MIRFEQVGDGRPKDIQVYTDDANAELAKMEDAFITACAEEMVSAVSLEQAKQDDGVWTFIIPGDEAGEVADIFDEEIRELSAFLDELNNKALDEIEGAS